MFQPQTLLAIYVSMLPVGPENDLQHWQNEWRSCKDAAASRELLQISIDYEKCMFKQVKLFIERHLAIVRRSAGGEIVDQAPKKRRRDSGIGGMNDKNSPAKRRRIAQSGSPVSARTRASTRREPAPSPEPAARCVAVRAVDDVEQVYHAHRRLITQLEVLMKLIVEAEEIETRQAGTDDERDQRPAETTASSAPQDHEARLQEIQHQAVPICHKIDSLALELKGWLTISNAIDHDLVRELRAWWLTEHESYFISLEHGPIIHWLQRTRQTFRGREYDQGEDDRWDDGSNREVDDHRHE